MAIDYSKYGREDLESVLQNIDREKYPENFRNASEALQAVIANPPADVAPQGPKGPIAVYRNFWRRFVAQMVDGLIMTPLGLAPYFLIRANFWIGFSSFLVLVPLGSAFHVFFHARYGATPGKMLAGLKLMTVDLKKVGLREALVRSAPEFFMAVAYTATLLPIVIGHREAIEGMGFLAFSQLLNAGSAKLVSRVSAFWAWSELLTMLFNEKRRAVHDFIAGTVVVRWQEPEG